MWYRTVSCFCSTNSTRCVTVKRHENHLVWKSCWAPVYYVRGFFWEGVAWSAIILALFSFNYNFNIDIYLTGYLVYANSQPLNYLHHMVNSPFMKEHVKCHSLLKINISLTIFEPNYFTSSELVVRNIICQTMYIIYFLSSYWLFLEPFIFCTNGFFWNFNRDYTNYIHPEYYF